MNDKATLVSSLDTQRNHVLGILEGLSDTDLQRPVLPSGWTCTGLVHHLAIDDERFWFRAVVAGEQSVIDSLAREEDAWRVGPEMTPEEVFDLYRQEIERANAIILAMEGIPSCSAVAMR